MSMSWKNDQVSEVETKKILELARECEDADGGIPEEVFKVGRVDSCCRAIRRWLA